MSENDELILTAMRDALDRIATYIHPVQKAEFLDTPMRVDATAMCLLVVGEGARQLSDEVKLALPAPWPSIISMRHRLAHAYPGVDHGVIWSAARDHAPQLRTQIADALEAR